jgi:protein gp37
MGDLFGNWVPDEWINRVLSSMMVASQHTYLLLTKNPRRLVDYRPHWLAGNGMGEPIDLLEGQWPDHIWLGTSVENHAAAEERIPLLLKAPAKHRWVSVEPLLGPINLRRLDASRIPGTGPGWCLDALDRTSGPLGKPYKHLDWVIIGRETGLGARPPHPDWAQSIIDQCRAARVPVFLKDSLKWPERIQEYPKEVKP